MQNTIRQEKVARITNDFTELPTANTSYTWPDDRYNSSDDETASQPDWWINAPNSRESGDEFVNVMPRDYEPIAPFAKMETTTTESPSFLPVQMIISWLPPKPPTAFDGFHINIEREGKVLLFLFI